MSGDYWLGVATPFVATAVLAVALTILRRVVARGMGYGWFIETGRAPTPQVDAWSSLERRGRLGFYLGHYRTTSGWGSRWLALGPVTVGKRAERWALSSPPPIHERTEPRPGQSYRWAGNT